MGPDAIYAVPPPDDPLEASLKSLARCQLTWVDGEGVGACTQTCRQRGLWLADYIVLLQIEMTGERITSALVQKLMEK